MTCGCKHILKLWGDAKLCGPAWLLGDELPAYFNFPRAKVREAVDEALSKCWVELACNRPDEHPVNGSKHWFDDGKGLRLEWDIPADQIWLAS